MTIRPAIKQFMIEAGILAFAICACVVIMQVHLRTARDKAVAAHASEMSTVIHELHSRPNQNSLPVQDLSNTSLT
jgi:hypothetical protein